MPVDGRRQTEISVATYNVHRCIGHDGRQDSSRTIEVLRELDADVIALQELEWHPEDALRRLDAFGAQLDCAPLAGPTLLKPGGHYGNVLLTRLQVKRVDRIDLSVPGREPRGALDVKLCAGDGELRVIATHLGLAPWERRWQMKRLLRKLNRGAMPTVLMGDLNEWFLWGRPLRWLRRHFGRTPAPRTFPARFPVLSLDRIWAEPRAILRDIAVHRSPAARAASDHLPVRAMLRLSGDRVS